MAGGMGRRDNDVPRETLAERVAATRARQTGLGHGTSGFHGTPPNASSAWTATPPPSSSPTSPPGRRPAGSPAQRVRPCWAETPWGRQPALLLQWRRTDNASGYSGLVVVAAPDETGSGWTVIRLWLDASLLTPSDS